MTAAWTPDGDYVDALRALLQSPRDAIAANTRQRSPASIRDDIKATIDNVRLITPEVAVEDGHIQHAAAPGEPPLRSRYTAVWVKRDSHWLLDSLREAALPRAALNSRLADVKWLLGDFAGHSLDGTRMIVTGVVSSDGNFVLREFFVTLPDGTRRRSSQRVGWDPLAGSFKSWTFHADGGYGEGVWKRQGDVWIVNNSGVTPDGKRTSVTTIYSKIGDESMIVAAVGAMVEDQSEPDMKLKLTRESPSE